MRVVFSSGKMYLAASRGVSSRHSSRSLMMTNFKAQNVTSMTVKGYLIVFH